ncbi:ATP-binding cassette domain-containing protein [Bradyrhizobium elkanii]|uniref:ATP-binding cassette domain-containing protein n=1 Tax=Bradyrhizobium elkanii TaxID=29448 RepID=UPI003B968FA8
MPPNPSFGDIRLENVTFRHGSQPKLFEDLNLTFRRGEMTAVVGESGSGKSSLAALLQNVYPLESGRIRIGPYDLKTSRPYPCVGLLLRYRSRRTYSQAR